MKKRLLYSLFIAFCCLVISHCNASDKTTKNPLLMSELDMEKLLDQWEDNDEDKLPDDELPPHKRKPTNRHMPNLDPGAFKNPEDFMKRSKKGQTLMTFVTVAGNPTRQETESITERWQVGLTNAHLKCQRYIIADDRAIFLFEDGSLAYEAKQFLLDQPELQEFSIDNQVFHGKGGKSDNTNDEL